MHYTIVLLRDRPDALLNVRFIVVGNQLAAEHKIKEWLDLGMERRNILLLEGSTRRAHFDVEDIVIRQPNTVTIIPRKI